MESWPCQWYERRKQAVFQAPLVSASLQQALIAGLCFLFVPFAVAQTTTELSSGVVERGEGFAVYRRVSATTDATGQGTVTTNQFTLLENCLNYFEDGQWKESEDLVESAPGGAVATRGPNKAVFSPDLNSPAVFDIMTSTASVCVAAFGPFK